MSGHAVFVVTDTWAVTNVPGTMTRLLREAVPSGHEATATSGQSRACKGTGPLANARYVQHPGPGRTLANN